MQNGKRPKEEIRRKKKVAFHFIYKLNIKQRKDVPTYKKHFKAQQACVYVVSASADVQGDGITQKSICNPLLGFKSYQ